MKLTTGVNVIKHFSIIYSPGGVMSVKTWCCTPISP